PIPGCARAARTSASSAADAAPRSCCAGCRVPTRATHATRGCRSWPATASGRGHGPTAQTSTKTRTRRNMPDPMDVARARAERVSGTHRRLTLATGESCDVGVHGPIKEHYGLDREKNLPLPVDYIVAATGG